MSLPGNQKKIDANKDGKITREDLMILRKQRKRRPVSVIKRKKATREKNYEN